LAIAVVVGILQTFTGTQPLCSCRLGPLHLTLTSDGLGAGGMVVARVVGSVSVLIALWAMAPAYGIFAALRWAGVPRTWVEIAMLMHRYTFALLEQAAGVLAAQKVRLGYAGLRQSLGSMGSLAGIVTLRSIDQAEKTHEAMLARGYHDSLQIPALPPLAKRDILLIACSIAIIALAWLITERSLP
jgi:cobalt/nickel transport system permease protein